ncbi:apolipoprotein N-acyltransferase [Sphingomonas sp.]|uniref:apolipoprotein N-acyltransferase n=1 Tax=Sphingomonas sp. TaxID=28214 RepID=UPI003B004F0A
MALALGLLVAFGFAPFGLWPLALAGYGGLALLLGERTGRPRAAFGVGWWFGLGQFVLGLDWIATAFTYQAAMPAWLGWVAVVLLSLYLAVFPGLATLAAWWATRRIGGGAATLSLALGACWAVAEWLRATVFTGFAWNPAAAAFVDLPLAHAARWMGTYGLSGLIVGSAGLLVILAAVPRDRLGRDTILSARNVPAAIGLVLLVGIYFVPGLARRLGREEPPAPGTGPLVTIVQPDIGQSQRWEPGLAAKHLARIAALSGRPRAEPRLLLWPESAIEDDLPEDPAVRAQVAAAIGPRDLLLAGGVQPVRDRSGEMVAARNSLFAVAPGARIVARYDKAHLVPYGEYLPMRPLLSAIGLSRLAPGDLDFLPGPGPRTLALPDGTRVGVQICYEIVFSGRVVDEAHRPAFLFNPSNDSWFGASGPPQHLAQARLRAIEEGLPVARATPTGISAIIDPEGRVVEKLDHHAMGMMTRRMPTSLPPTLFSRLGNMSVFVTALVLAGLAFAARRYKEGFI